MTQILSQELKNGGKERWDFLFFASCLRALVSSCEKPVVSHRALAWRFLKSLIFLCGGGAKRCLVSCLCFVAKLRDSFLDRICAFAFLFSHEGTKARRHEGDEGFSKLNQHAAPYSPALETDFSPIFRESLATMYLRFLNL